MAAHSAWRRGPRAFARAASMAGSLLSPRPYILVRQAPLGGGRRPRPRGLLRLADQPVAEAARVVRVSQHAHVGLDGGRAEHGELDRVGRDT